jgi:hypothetical protein
MAVSNRSGSLIVLGTGIEAIGHVTLAARRALEGADEVLHLVPDPLTRRWIESLNPVCESLQSLYQPGRDRALIYGAIAARVLVGVRAGRRVCTAIYGHPGVFVHAGHEAIRIARAEGHRARMLPAISSEDCLFADLGVDPGVAGCQSYEATNFLMRRRNIDVSVPLILWQIGVIGVFDHRPAGGSEGLRMLAEVLSGQYGGRHEAIVYEASLLGICQPRADRLALGELATAVTTSASTLFVPPARSAEWDGSMIERLGIDLDEGARLEAQAASRSRSQDYGQPR